MFEKLRLMKKRWELARDVAAKMSIKEFVVFAIVVFFGALVGNWIVQLVGISSTDLLGQLLAFLIPTLAIYVLWKKAGAAVAK